MDASTDYGLAWLTPAEFADGTVSLQVRGKDLAGQSFVGIAFHGFDHRRFDAIYFRAFNFRSDDPAHRSHALQYVSLPKYDWSDLRQNDPGKYEAALNPAPAPSSWVKVKIVVAGRTLSTFIDEGSSPALKIELLGNADGRKLGLWVGNGSDGCFKDLVVSPSTK